MLAVQEKQIPLSEFGIKSNVSEGENQPSVKGLGDIFNPAIPTKQPHYFKPQTIMSLLRFMTFPANNAYWIFGLQGTGKTSTIEQMCARLNWPLYSITGSESLEIEDMLYTNSLTGGDSGVRLEALAKAFTYGGVFLVNEVDMIDPSKLPALNELIVGNTLTIPGIDEVLVRHKNFRFIVTANTNGSYDESTNINFGGTNTMNPAFLDRFIFHELDYLPENVEESILCKFMGEVQNAVNGSECKKQIAQARPIIRNMIAVANETRQAARNSDDYDRPISMRGLKRFAQNLVQYRGSKGLIKLSIQEAVLNSLPKSQKESVERFCEDVFGSDYSDAAA